MADEHITSSEDLPGSKKAKAKSKRRDIGTIERGFREGLRTWEIHDAWPSLPDCFRTYRLLLEYHEFRKPKEIPEREYSDLVSKIETRLDVLANRMDGTFKTKGSTIANIRWNARGNPHTTSLYTGPPIRIGENDELQMRPKSDFEQQDQTEIIDEFSLDLTKLESLIARSSAPGADDLGINEPHAEGQWPDMVGWALKGKKPTAEFKKQKLRSQKRKFAPSEALLDIKGCGMHIVETKRVEKGKRLHAIARLQMHYEGQGPGELPYIGTGWLVDSTTIATAGHCVYDETLGFLTTVHVTFGSQTKQPTRRYGTHAVVHWAWYASFSGKSDIGFVRLEPPQPDEESQFASNVVPLPYIETPDVSPVGGKLIARGYPCFEDRPDHLRESKCKANYDLSKTDYSLEYELDTYGGSSGCPIFDQDENVVGIHSRTGTARGDHHPGGKDDINKGVIIDGDDNNPTAFSAVLDHIEKGGPLKGLSRGMSSEVVRYTFEKL